MAAPPADSVGAETQHGEAEPRAVLVSSGVAGVHGTVRHGAVAGGRAGARLGFGLPQEEEKEGAGGRRHVVGGASMSTQGERGARHGAAGELHGGMAHRGRTVATGRCQFYGKTPGTVFLLLFCFSF